jgi:hypothetical protein
LACRVGPGNDCCFGLDDRAGRDTGTVPRASFARFPLGFRFLRTPKTGQVSFPASRPVRSQRRPRKRDLSRFRWHGWSRWACVWP